MEINVTCTILLQMIQKAYKDEDKIKHRYKEFNSNSFFQKRQQEWTEENTRIREQNELNSPN